MIKNKTRYKIAILFVAFVLCSLSFLQAQEKTKSRPFVVILDAGHGGKDSGNRGNGYYEKNIALSIVLGIGEILSKDPNIKVIYTRKKDVFVELGERAKIANEADADLFVSVHCDSFTSSKVFGAGTFVLGLHAHERNFRIAQKENSVIFLEEDYEKKYDGFDPNNPESVISLVLMQEDYQNQSIEAASAIQNSFVKNLGRKDRAVKQAGFLVLRNTYMPSVLVEVGFLTNKKEGAFLNSWTGRKKMSETIAKAIKEYRNSLLSFLKNNDTEIVNLEKEKVKSKKKEKVYPIFKVQLEANRKKKTITKKYFKGLSPITEFRENGYYKYLYGSTTSYEKAKRNKEKVRKKGYHDAFIVAFKGNKKIAVSKAISERKKD